MKAKLIKQWNWNNDSAEEGTEVRIIKGMETDSEGVLNAPYGMCYLCELDGKMLYIPAIYLRITDWDNIDWNQIRIQASISAMQGFLANPSFYGDVTGPGTVADNSVQFADELIQKLKEGGS